MPTIKISKKVIEEKIKKKLSLEELKDRISMLGTDLDGLDGDEITVEVFPNRPDMLSEQGFARALASFVKSKTGLRKYKVKSSGSHTKVEKTLKAWPYVVTFITKGLKFDDERIKEIIQVQEKLHTTLLRKRKKGGIGIYPLDKIQLPITFTTRKAEDIKFRPLEHPQEINGKEILQRHPTGKAFGHIIENEEEFPIFLDANQQIMSMPPIINSHDVGKIDEETKDIFVECTGTDLNILTQVINILASTFAEMGGEVLSMDIIYKDKKLTIPDLNPIKLKLNPEYVNKKLGLELKESEIRNLLEQMGHDYRNKTVLVPAYRTDIINEVDLVEDIAIAYGYENFIPEIPNITTTGIENKFETFKRRISYTLTGFGYLETKSYNLTSPEIQNKKMSTELKLVEVENPNTHEYSVLRTWITPSLLQILSENRHNEYPQNIFEIGNCFKENEEFTRLALLTCHKDANYTEIKQIIESLLNLLGLEYKLEEVEHPSFIPGRVARISIKDKNIAYIGELHPLVLDSFELEMPASCLELNLTELFNIINS